jgi:hypothetical protein
MSRVYRAAKDFRRSSAIRKASRGLREWSHVWTPFPAAREMVAACYFSLISSEELQTALLVVGFWNALGGIGFCLLLR